MEKDTLSDDLEDFKLCLEAESEQRKVSQDDLEFALLEKQWDQRDVDQRAEEGRPCLTINRLPSFIKQVTNDGRLNRPSINVKPVGSGANKDTAGILSDLIRNIETVSQADIVYDTAYDFAVACGFGYYRINVDYSSEDEWDQDISLSRISNPFSVFGDYEGKEATSIDWNRAYVTDWYSKSAFEAKWGKDRKASSFETEGDVDQEWFQDKRIRVAERWLREEVKVPLLKLSNGMVLLEPEFFKLQDNLTALGVTVQGTRDTRTYKVRQRLITGTDVLEENDWLGKYIPIVPMYGEEVNVAGKRHFISLVRRAKDPQRMFNYWRPLALDTRLPTPTGWTTMGEIKVGEQLFDENGRPCNVIGKSPVHIHRDCFKVTFDDGSHIVADACHPWQVEERRGKSLRNTTWETKQITTAEMVPGKHFIQTPKPLRCESADLPIHPYLLGLWLGDGTSVKPEICPGDEDINEVRELLSGLGYDLGPVQTNNGKRHGVFSVRGISDAMRSLRLLGNKHIPEAYLRASEEQRWALLAGLMDSDGSITKRARQCSFVTTNEAIAEGFSELVRSLGIKAVSLRREGRHSKLVGAGSVVQDFLQFSFSCYPDEPVFRLTRKAAIQRAGSVQHRRRTKRFRIVSVEPVPSVPVQCVAVDAPSHLFLAGESMVPTHNTCSTEMVALAPKAPWVGAVGQFATDPKWATANRAAHQYLEYDVVDGAQGGPQRQPFAGVPAGALQEALNASDDMKSIMGIYDASLGARSNETSGRAINARDRQGDIATFDFMDNRNRSVEHGGRIIVDLIPKVYSVERVMRCVQEDGTTYNVPVNQPVAPAQELRKLEQAPMPGMMPPQMPMQGPGMPPQGAPMGQMMQEQPEAAEEQGGPPEYVPVPPELQQRAQMNPAMAAQMAKIVKTFDLTAGKYDVTVTAGPGFATRREEASQQMMEFIRIFPQSAPLIGDLLAKNLDWPGAEQVAERLKAMLPPQAMGKINPMVQQLQGMLQQQDAQAKQAIGQLQQQLAQFQRQLADKQAEHQAKTQELGIKQFEAETKRAEVMKPETQQVDPLKVEELKLQQRETAIKEYEAETERLKVLGATITPEAIQMLVMQTVQNAMHTPPITDGMGMEMPEMGMPPMQDAPMQHTMPDGSVMDGPPMMGEQMPPEQPMGI